MAITANTPMLLSNESQAALKLYLQQCRNAQLNTVNMREVFRNIDMAYQREQDWTKENRRAKIANTYGDANKFQNVTVPVVMPQVEAAVTYQSSVFLTGTPLFGVVSDPANINAAIQMETVIDDQAIKGAWVKEFMMIFRDAFKYNFYAVEVSWQQIVTAALETDLSFSSKQAKPKEVIWEGNKIRRLDPYNTIFDMRVAPHEIHQKAEFAGFTELMSRIQLKSYIATLPNKIISNVKTAFESGVGSGNSGGVMVSSPTSPFYRPQINPDALIPTNLRDGYFDWNAWAGTVDSANNGINYRNAYQVTTMYARILPDDFGMKVPARQTPQVWKFVWVNDQILIYAERQTNAHGYIPILCGQATIDGLDYQTKSLATNVTSFQQLSSALWNSVIASRRRAISDRTLYDPSRVSDAHINNANPSAKIPVRPAAYGKPVSDAVFPFPFRDDQAAIIVQEVQQLDLMANKTSNQNAARQGQFVKGNKTRSEFDTTMAAATGPDQMTSMNFESVLFSPLKEILKINILQFQGGVSLFNRDSQKQIEVDPIILRQAVLTFKISDGLVPSDKFISAEAMRDGFQALANIPMLGAGYNLPPMFSYLMKIAGAQISAFEKSSEQQAYEQAVAQWQNLVLQIIKANPQATAANFPPEPLPQQFNYNPTGTSNTTGTPTNGNQETTNT